MSYLWSCGSIHNHQRCEGSQIYDTAPGLEISFAFARLPCRRPFVFSEEAKHKLFLLTGAQTHVEPLRSLLPQVRTHFNTALLNIAELRPHLCVCHSCFKALRFPPLSLFPALGFRLLCLNGPRLVDSLNSFATSTGRAAADTGHSKFSYTALFEYSHVIGDDQTNTKTLGGSFKNLPGPNLIHAGGCTLHSSVSLHPLLLFHSRRRPVLSSPHSSMTARCSSLTMAPTWTWSPLWPSSGTSWRASSRMTQGEARGKPRHEHTARTMFLKDFLVDGQRS